MKYTGNPENSSYYYHFSPTSASTVVTSSSSKGGSLLPFNLNSLPLRLVTQTCDPKRSRSPAPGRVSDRRPPRCRWLPFLRRIPGVAMTKLFSPRRLYCCCCCCCGGTSHTHHHQHRHVWRKTVVFGVFVFSLYFALLSFVSFLAVSNHQGGLGRAGNGGGVGMGGSRGPSAYLSPHQLTLKVHITTCLKWNDDGAWSSLLQ